MSSLRHPQKLNVFYNLIYYTCNLVHSIQILKNRLQQRSLLNDNFVNGLVHNKTRIREELTAHKPNKVSILKPIDSRRSGPLTLYICQPLSNSSM